MVFIKEKRRKKLPSFHSLANTATNKKLLFPKTRRKKLTYSLKGFDILISSTDNRSFKQTNFPFFCASSCPSYLKSSYYEINMRSRPRSWPSSVASRPAGRPGSGRSRRKGRWQRCFTLRRFKSYPESWKTL